jgi:SAM-dependent methyltransferase
MTAMGLEFFRQDVIPARQVTFLAEFVQDMEPGRMMELGCSTGKKSLKLLSELGWDCVGIDVNTQVLEEAAQYGTVYLTKGEEPLYFIEDSSFDLVCAFNVFHHIQDAKRSFSELVRCLKSGGVFLITEIVEDSLFMRQGRNVFQNWEGMPVLSRMWVKDWLTWFSEYPVDLYAFYARTQWAGLLEYVFYLFRKFPFIGEGMYKRYWSTLKYKKCTIQVGSCVDVQQVLFVARKQ